MTALHKYRTPEPEADDGQELNPENQAHWRAIVDRCAYTVTAIINEYDLESSSFFRYLKLDTTPKKHWERMVQIMKKLGGGQQRLQRHPSYGYATPEQIEQLQKLGLGPTRDHILRQIEKQNQNQGKVK